MKRALHRDDFVGRARELELLEQQYGLPGGAFVPVYGRRRVGESELIVRFLRGHRGIAHLGIDNG